MVSSTEYSVEDKYMVEDGEVLFEMILDEARVGVADEDGHLDLESEEFDAPLASTLV